MNRLGCMIVIALLCAAGCTESSGGVVPRDRTTRTDGGRVVARDSGASSARDSGVVAARDGGAIPASDGGPGPGPGPGDPGPCTTDIVSPPTAVACAAVTLSCIDACPDQACFEACLARDPDPAGCTGCMDQAFVSCVNAAGCQAQWDALGCCLDTCADPASDACRTTTCAAQSSAFDVCLMAHGDSCATSDMVCFAVR